jgi:hypothetical protein
MEELSPDKFTQIKGVIKEMYDVIRHRQRTKKKVG